jgi:serine/threonine protein kinase
VALKMLRHRFIYDDHIQGRFDQEARLLEDLVHPNIVSLRDHFLAYRTRFLVLDLCDGADLFRVLRVRGPLDESIVRAILGQVAEGVLYLHDSGVIHRDLKPGNVLVDRSGRVRLTDFGLSKLLESEVPEGKAVGTPSYMPPEQFRTADVGPPCDWYAIGCLIFEMLTAQILFTAANWTEMFDLKRRTKPSDRWPVVDASPELRQIIRGAIEPKAKDRQLDLEAISRWSEKVERLFGS